MSKKVYKEDSYNMPFPIRLRELVNESGSSQEDLGDAIGVSRQTISNYLDGSKKPNYLKVIAMSRYFNVTVEYLLGLTNSKSKNSAIRNISDEIGLSDDAIKVLRDKKDRKIFTEAISLLIEYQEILDSIIEYMWCGLLPRLYEEPGFCDLPKDEARINDADKILLFGFLQNFGKLKDVAADKHKGNEPLVKAVLNEAARKYYDSYRCQLLWNKWHGNEVINGSDDYYNADDATEGKDTAVDEDAIVDKDAIINEDENNDISSDFIFNKECQDVNEAIDREYRAFEAIIEYLSDIMIK